MGPFICSRRATGVEATTLTDRAGGSYGALMRTVQPRARR
jgi:hypothetical protein